MAIMFNPGCTTCCDDGGGSGIATDCCAVNVPETLHATLTQTTVGVCSNLSPVSFDLIYDSGTGKWIGTLAAAAGCTWEVTLSCESTGSGFRWRTLICLNDVAGTPTVPCANAGGSGCMVAGGADYIPDVDMTCSPFSLTDATTSGLSGAACCGCVQPPFGVGVWTTVITE